MLAGYFQAELNIWPLSVMCKTNCHFDYLSMSVSSSRVSWQTLEIKQQVMHNHMTTVLADSNSSDSNKAFWERIDSHRFICKTS